MLPDLTYSTHSDLSAGRVTHILDSSFWPYVNINTSGLCSLTTLVGLSAGQALIAITQTQTEPVDSFYEAQ